MINEKYRYEEKLWNQVNIFDQTDLALNCKYLYFTEPDELKKLYRNIVTNIIYGGKVTDQQDIETIDLHIQETIKNTNLDRTYFWQTVWADDRFPKNQQQHEQYLKNSVINKIGSNFKTIYQMYGITSFVINHVKQKQYRQVSNFYHLSRK